MTAGLASSLVSDLLNTLRPSASGGAAYGPIVATYIQLHTGDPGAAGTSNVSVGSTTRNSFVFSSSSSGSGLSLATPPSAWTNGGTSETITHISVWTASSAGTLRLTFALTTGKAWASGDQFNLTALSVSLTPQAA